jgi:hypothetical protein
VTPSNKLKLLTPSLAVDAAKKPLKAQIIAVRQWIAQNLSVFINRDLAGKSRFSRNPWQLSKPWPLARPIVECSSPCLASTTTTQMNTAASIFDKVQRVNIRRRPFLACLVNNAA